MENIGKLEMIICELSKIESFLDLYLRHPVQDKAELK